MKFNHPYIEFWDEMPSPQIPLKAESGQHLSSSLKRRALSTYLADEVALLIFLLFLSLD
jgi:hypothetical protein